METTKILIRCNAKNKREVLNRINKFPALELVTTTCFVHEVTEDEINAAMHTFQYLLNDLDCKIETITLN